MQIGILMASAHSCFAWGGEGHQIVALIAENHLTPESQNAVHDLLDNANLSDAEVANWADQIRDDRPESKQWHYVNIPVTAKNGFDRKRDGNQGNNVIDKITDFANILADKSKSKVDRAEALKFLTHFIGDVHQPLHAADRNDLGGNKCMVTYPKKSDPYTLHAVWDTQLIRTYIATEKIADYSNDIDKRVPKKLVDEISRGTPADWANESLSVAIKHVYNGIPANGQTAITPNYINNNRTIVEQQLARGGLRLAKVLNEIFAAKK